jgi:polar amino acid transport system substrate-binding protein
MKKVLFLFSLLVSVFALSACSTDTDVLRVGMDLRYPPFETVDEENMPYGISVDTAMAFGEFIGREVEIVNLEFGTLITALQTGEIDIAIASMSITEEREESVDFTDPYFYFKIISLVNQDFATENNLTMDSTVEDLLAIDGAQFIGIANQISATIPIDNGVDPANVTEAVDVLTAVEEVSQGTADILFMSANPVVDGYNANANTTMVVWDAVVSSPIGMAVQEGNAELLQQANDFIDTFNDEDGLYAQLRLDWNSVVQEKLGSVDLDFYINE